MKAKTILAISLICLALSSVAKAEYRVAERISWIDNILLELSVKDFIDKSGVPIEEIMALYSDIISKKSDESIVYGRHNGLIMFIDKERNIILSLSKE